MAVEKLSRRVKGMVAMAPPDAGRAGARGGACSERRARDWCGGLRLGAAAFWPPRRLETDSTGEQSVGPAFRQEARYPQPLNTALQLIGHPGWEEA